MLKNVLQVKFINIYYNYNEPGRMICEVIV